MSGANDGGITSISLDTVPLNTIVSGSLSGAFQEPNDSVPTGTDTNAEQAAAVPVNDSVILSTTPSGVYTQATFQITGNYATGEDILTFTNSSGMGNISGSFDASTGTMTLTSSGNTATLTRSRVSPMSPGCRSPSMVSTTSASSVVRPRSTVHRIVRDAW